MRHFNIPISSTRRASFEGGNTFALNDTAQAYRWLLVEDATALAQRIVQYIGKFRCLIASF